MLDEMVETGALNPDVAARHPLKTILRAALTGREIDLIDQSPAPLELQENDIILIASDGIQTLRDEEICDIVTKSAQADASAIAAQLLQAVLDADYAKQDNTIVAVIKATAAGFIAHSRPPGLSTRAVLPTNDFGELKWCAATRHITRSNDPSAYGNFSAACFNHDYSSYKEILNNH